MITTSNVEIFWIVNVLYQEGFQLETLGFYTEIKNDLWHAEETWNFFYKLY